MAHIWNLKHAVLVGCIVFNVDLHAWQTLIGNDSSRTDQTFSFGIKAHCAQPGNNLMLVGAEYAGEGKEYSLSRISLHDYKVASCAPELAMVNGVYDQPNPLYNAAIKYLVCPNSTHAVIYTAANKSTLYDLNHFNPESELLSLVIHDAAGKPCESITQLETNGENTIFVAYKSGTEKCGIALVSYAEKNEQVEINDADFKKLEKEATECKDDPKKFARLKRGVEMGQDGKPYRKVITKSFKQEEALIQLPEHVKDITAVCWHAGTGCLYVAVSYKSPIEDQSCGILVGVLQADKSMVLEPLATGYIDLLRDGSITSMVPFISTTGYLDYLLIKNSSTPEQIHSVGLCNQRVLEERKVFASQGKLAAITQKPQDIFESRRNKFLGRQFNKPFVAAADSPSLIAHAIGCGYLYAGPIDEILVRGDVIFATVSNPINGHSAGIYQSQALYDSVGRIAGWAFWQKTLEHDGLDFAIINNAKSNMLIFSQDREGEKGTRTARTNKWPEKATDEIAQLIEVAQKEFVENKLEIRKLIDFSILTPGLAGKNLTLLMSDTKLVVAQMPDFASVTFDQKSIESIGTLTCAQVGISNDQGWLFVGGTHGLAKMALADGSGWHMPTGLQNVDELKDCIAQRIGDYTMVRKLLFDQGILYILTDSCLDRIDLETNDVTRLGHVQNLCNQRYSIFYDLIVSDKCALLATSDGLMRVGNGKNIRTDGQSSINWIKVNVPDATDLPLFLLPVSVSGNPHDWAKGAGQIYIITGSYTKKGAHVHRFAVQDVVNQEICDATIAPVPDLVFKDRIGDIGSLLTCSDCFLTDGLFYLAPIRQKKSRAVVLYNGLTKARTTINLDLAVEDTITSISRNSTHGNWLVAGSFGLKTNI